MDTLSPPLVSPIQKAQFFPSISASILFNLSISPSLDFTSSKTDKLFDESTTGLFDKAFSKTELFLGSNVLFPKPLNPICFPLKFKYEIYSKYK